MNEAGDMFRTQNDTTHDAKRRASLFVCFFRSIFRVLPPSSHHIFSRTILPAHMVCVRACVRAWCVFVCVPICVLICFADFGRAFFSISQPTCAPTLTCDENLDASSPIFSASTAMEVPSMGSHRRLTGGTICWLRYLQGGRSIDRKVRGGRGKYSESTWGAGSKAASRSAFPLSEK